MTLGNYFVISKPFYELSKTVTLFHQGGKCVKFSEAGSSVCDLG